MPRILAIDYGAKRTGIAVTDPLKIIATGLTTIASSSLLAFLAEYMKSEYVELILIGLPKNLNGTETHATGPVRQVMDKLKKAFPQITVQPLDERFTSKLATRALIEMGLGKKQRQQKELLDKMAATIMLQEYLSRTSAHG